MGTVLPMDDSRHELVEIVSQTGDVERVVERHVMRVQRLRHRATFIALVDSEDRLVMHRRSPGKDVWPSRWDIAAGGCCNVGEEWLDGAQRELAEELGVSAPLTHLGFGLFEDDDVKVYGAIYVARYDGAVSFDDGEVVEARWVSLAELDEFIAAGEPFCPDSISLVLPLLQEWLAGARPG